MTDFFADLEKELRTAHPRRPKPVVPVRPIAVTAAVLVAVAVTLGTLAPNGEKEMAQQPPQTGWTAYAPQCNQVSEPRTVDDPVPDALTERFLVLRDGEAALEPVLADLPEVREIYSRGVRVIHNDASTDPLAILPVRLGCPGDRGELGMCLIRLTDKVPQPHACAAIGAEPGFIVSVVDPIRDGVFDVGVLASDSAVDRVVVAGGTGPENRSPKWNLVVARITVDSARDISIGLGPPQGEEVIPLNCAGQPDMGPLKERLAIFREPPAENSDGIEMALPDGYHRVFLTEARVAEFGKGIRYLVVPVGDATCGTHVCLVRMGSDKTGCSGLPASAKEAVVLTLEHEGRFAALVTDGVRSVTVTTTEENRKLEPQGSVVEGPVSGKVLGVYTGS